MNHSKQKSADEYMIICREIVENRTKY